MKRLLPVLLSAVLLASCTSHPVRRAVPSTSPQPASPTAAPIGTPRSDRHGLPFVEPAGKAVPESFVPADATFVSDRTGWVLGAAACPHSHLTCPWIARTHDGGATWRGIELPAGEEARSLRFANERDGFLTASPLLETRDGGATWQGVSVPGLREVIQVEAARGRVWVLGHDSVGRAAIWRAQLGSEKYVRASVVVPAGADSPVLALHGASAFLTYTDPATDLTRLLVSADGARFASHRLPCTSDLPLGSIALQTARVLLLVCSRGDGNVGQEPKAAWRSGDQGRTWWRLPEPAQLFPTLVAASARSFFAADRRYLRALSADGTGWTGRLDVGDLAEIQAIGFESARLGFVLVSSGTTTIRVTHDDGRTWETVDFRRTG